MKIDANAVTRRDRLFGLGTAGRFVLHATPAINREIRRDSHRPRIRILEPLPAEARPRACFLRDVLGIVALPKQLERGLIGGAMKLIKALGESRGRSRRSGHSGIHRHRVEPHTS